MNVKGKISRRSPEIRWMETIEKGMRAVSLCVCVCVGYVNNRDKWMRRTKVVESK